MCGIRETKKTHESEFTRLGKLSPNVTRSIHYYQLKEQKSLGYLRSLQKCITNYWCQWNKALQLLYQSYKTTKVASKLGYVQKDDYVYCNSSVIQLEVWFHFMEDNTNKIVLPKIVMADNPTNMLTR